MLEIQAKHHTFSMGDSRVAEIGLDAGSESKLFDPILEKNKPIIKLSIEQ
jgi:hypothetical protein